MTISTVYKKHHPPHLRDAIWRLDKIGKEGVFHKRLAAEGVHTVHDLLRLLVIDPSSLRRVRLFFKNLFIYNITEHSFSCKIISVR